MSSRLLLLALLLALSIPLSAGESADRIVIIKSARTMTLMDHGKIIKSYKVGLGPVPVGPKTKQGDLKTPEGNYVINGKNPHSEFHLALHLSYPNATDRQRARQLGVNPGGDVEIHGFPPGYDAIDLSQPPQDWTNGCIAVTNPEIEEIWKLVPVGTRVEIRP